MPAFSRVLTLITITVQDERISLGLPGRDTTGGSGANIATKALMLIEAMATAPDCEKAKSHLAEK
jgi:hypothetical protein